jgi:N-methylhydantoinase B
VGDPLEREVEKVRWDVLNEYISVEAAKESYGVVIDPATFVVDDTATKALREGRKSEASG